MPSIDEKQAYKGVAGCLNSSAESGTESLSAWLQGVLLVCWGWGEYVEEGVYRKKEQGYPRSRPKTLTF